MVELAGRALLRVLLSRGSVFHELSSSSAVEIAYEGLLDHLPRVLAAFRLPTVSGSLIVLGKVRSVSLADRGMVVIVRGSSGHYGTEGVC